MDKMRELEAPPSPQGYSGMQPDDLHRVRSGPGTNTSKVGRASGSENLNEKYINLCALGIVER